LNEVRELTKVIEKVVDITLEKKRYEE